MLSTAHAIFRGLQDEVCNTLRSLPDSTSPMIKNGLLGAHQKLSEYYYRFDLSPFYLWAARKSYHPFSSLFKHDWLLSEVLDPRVSYDGLKTDYAQDVDLLADLEKAKSALRTFYHDKYSSFTSSTKKTASTTAPVVQNGSPGKVDFTARYKKKTAECLMNSKITSSLGRRILIRVSLLIGGGGDVPNFLICTVLLETSLLFLVNLFASFPLYMTKDYIRICSCSWAHFLWWPWHYFFATCKSPPWHYPPLDAS